MDNHLDELGERIAEQAAHLDAAMHRLLVDLCEFDERGGWHAQGATSCAHWLAWRVGWELVTARDHVRVARKLPGFPAIGDALRRGEVSYSKVRAMLRAATPENEPLLLEYAKLMTASQLEKLCRKYMLVQRHSKDPHPLGDLQRRYVRRRDTEDGMVKIEAVLHPDEAELVWTMLNHAAGRLARGSGLSAGSDAVPSGGEHAAPSATLTAAPLDADPDDEADSVEASDPAMPIAATTTASLADGDPAHFDSAGDRSESHASSATVERTALIVVGRGHVDDSAASSDPAVSHGAATVVEPDPDHLDNPCAGPAPYVVPSAPAEVASLAVDRCHVDDSVEVRNPAVLLGAITVASVADPRRAHLAGRTSTILAQDPWWSIQLTSTIPLKCGTLLCCPARPRWRRWPILAGRASTTLVRDPRRTCRPGRLRRSPCALWPIQVTSTIPLKHPICW
jgi:hypothetical protein